jgi:hypothetical protein
MGTVAAMGTMAPARARTWRVLDLGRDCLLRESIAGFCGSGIPVCRAPKDGQECRFYVVPGVGSLPEELARRLSAFTRGGGWVVFESAAGFGGFEDQRRMLAGHFGIRIQPPVDLWASGTAPYIDYRWPVRERVRDFSRVTPISAEGLEIIGSAGPHPVAAKHGRFIFLGSPMGPALLAGDREAHSWFSALASGFSRVAPSVSLCDPFATRETRQQRS